MTDYRYGPGEWTALAHGGRAALLDPAIDAESVTTIWELLSQGGSLESWLEVLAGNGLASLPSFGFVEPGDDGVRVVVRGGVTGLVENQEISAGGIRTWREHVAAAGSGVVLQVASSEVSHPLVGGVVLASTLQVGELPEPVADDAVVAADEIESDDAESDGEAVAAAAVEHAAEVDEQPAEVEEQPAEIDEQLEEADEQPEEADEQSVEVEEQPAEADEQPVEGSEQVAQPSDEVEPDFVLDDDDDDDEGRATEPQPFPGTGEEWAAGGAALNEQLPTGQEAAGEAPIAPPEPQPWAVPAAPAPQANQWGPPVQQAAEPSFESQPQDPQPWQPQAGQVQPEQQPFVEEHADQLGDHDGYTMRAADLPKPAEEPPVDHTLAPAQDEGSDQGTASQGPVMQLSLSTGQQVELDRPVLIGRAPESSRFGFGETPRLVTVPSPQQDISRTHVEIKVEGDSVLVTDLRSTNGTVVVLPGSPPRRLHPGESVPVPTGTVVDLGDGVTAVVGLPDSAAPIAY